jgi:hypothetical protein
MPSYPDANFFTHEAAKQVYSLPFLSREKRIPGDFYGGNTAYI